MIERQRETILLPGDLPSPANPPAACRFHTRCPYIQPTRCTEDVPPLRKLSDGHLVACHWAEDIKASRIQPKERYPPLNRCLPSTKIAADRTSAASVNDERRSPAWPWNVRSRSPRR